MCKIIVVGGRTLALSQRDLRFYSLTFSNQKSLQRLNVKFLFYYKRSTFKLCSEYAVNTHKVLNSFHEFCDTLITTCILSLSQHQHIFES